MKKLVRFSGFMLLMAMLTNCRQTKQFVEFTHGKELTPNKGRIYVIKPSFVGSAVGVSIFCDDILIGRAISGSYLAWDVEEGKHTIGNTQLIHAGNTLGAAGSEDLFKISTKAGKTYYLEISPRFGGMNFNILDTKKGEKIIKNRKKPKVNYVE